MKCEFSHGFLTLLLACYNLITFAFKVMTEYISFTGKLLTIASTHDVVSHLQRIQNYVARVILHIPKSANNTHLRMTSFTSCQSKKHVQDSLFVLLLSQLYYTIICH